MRGKNIMKYLIYPFYDECSSLIELLGYKEENAEFEYVVYPMAWTKKVNIPVGISGSCDYEECLNFVKGVIIADISKYPYLYQDIIKKIHIALDNGCAVKCCAKLEEEDRKEFENLSEQFFYYQEDPRKIQDVKNNGNPYQIQDCVVVGVGNLLQEMDSLEEVSHLYKKLSKEGYKISVITSNRNGMIMGYNLFPEEILQDAYDTQVLELNRYFNKVQEEDHADILLVQIDGGMLKYSNICYGDFGVKSYIVSQALAIDYFLLVSPVVDMTQENYQELSTIFKHRFGYNIDAVLFENLYIDLEESDSEEKIIYRKIDEIEMQKIMERNYIPGSSDIIYGSNSDTKVYDLITENCIEKLSSDYRQI